MGIMQAIEAEQLRHTVDYRIGDQVRVHVRIKEGDKERIQVFEGVVIAVKRGNNRGSFIVRKMSYGIGVERSFPIHSPSIEKVEIVTHGKVRRARLYYLRGRRGKAARLKERDMRLIIAKRARRAESASAAAANEAASNASDEAPVPAT